jgi:hypothetical protein
MNMHRSILALIIAPLIAQAQPWINDGKVVWTLPNPITVEGVGVVHNPPMSLYRAAGWFDFVPCAGVEGSNIASRTTTTNGFIVTEVCGYESIVTPEIFPATFPDGIEVSWISIVSLTNQVGWVYVALDDGTLVPVLGHESPWPSQAELDARIKAATDKARNDKARAKNGINGQIQQRLENIERLLNIRE